MIDLDVYEVFLRSIELPSRCSLPDQRQIRRYMDCIDLAIILDPQQCYSREIVVGLSVNEQTVNIGIDVNAGIVGSVHYIKEVFHLSDPNVKTKIEAKLEEMLSK